MKYKVMIVEDESQIRDIVAKYLERAGFEVIEAKDGFEGLSRFEEFQPHFVVLDVMMPGISGFDVLREIRHISEVPVIMLTAKQEEVDRLKGFDMGADDYVSKPFSPRELVRRIEAVIRRVYKVKEDKEILTCGALELNLAKHTLKKEGQDIEITSKEFNLLKVFFMNQDQLLTRDQLIQDAFGPAYDGFDRNVDSYIKKIRQKIEENTRRPKYLRTKYGAGYIFGGNVNDD
jgi:DNA-binding response OmpR family regulator